MIKSAFPPKASESPTGFRVPHGTQNERENGISPFKGKQ